MGLFTSAAAHLNQHKSGETNVETENDPLFVFTILLASRSTHFH
jgi:hypothetical protein